MIESRSSRKMLQAQTKERICKAATELIVAKGFHATSIQDIVEKAGFSKGAFFSNFVSKAELLITLSEQLKQDERTRLLCVLETSHEAFSLQALDEYINGLKNKRICVILELELQMMALRDEDFNQYYQQLNTINDIAFGEILAGLFTKLGKKPPLPITTMIHVFSALIQGLTLQGIADPSQMFKQVLEIIINGAENQM